MATTKESLQIRLKELSDTQIINILDCKEELNRAIKYNPLAKWRKILEQTLIKKILDNEIDEILLIFEEMDNIL